MKTVPPASAVPAPRWVLPMASTSVWAALSYLHMDNLCWFGYNHKIYYWVSEGPRLVIIVVRGAGRAQQYAPIWITFWSQLYRVFVWLAF